MADHADWMGAMDQDATMGADTAGHGDWFNAMDQDATFGDSPPAAMKDVSHTEVPKDWNLGSSVGQGLLQGHGIQAAAALGAASEARRWLANGASWDFVKGKLPDWYAQYRDHLSAAKDQYHEVAGGSDLLGETVGSVGSSLFGTGVGMSAARAGLERVGLPGAARFIGGTAGRLMPETSSAARGAKVATNLASRATSGAIQGAADSVQQSGLNKDVPLGEQVTRGTALGTILSPLSYLTRGAHVTPEDARAGIIAEGDGVPVRAGALAQNPVRQAFSRSVGSHPDTPAALARARDQIEHDYHNVGARAAIIQPEVQQALEAVRARELALDRIGPRLEHTPHGNSLMHFLGRHVGGAAAGLTGGLTIAALEGIPEFFSNPKAMAASVALGAAGLGARKLGNVVANRRPYRLLQLRANALGLSPADYLGLPSVPIAAANRLMEYNPHAQ